ncbi:MAG: translocation and assembly module TamB, partial [Planctomycetota bacterium]
GEVSSALVVRGTLRAPRIEGTLAMPRGTITFPGCTFRTSNALLQFDRNDSSFPTVSLTAAGRRHGYDVRMVIRGSYHAPEIQLSSTPPLPAEQLAVLVTTGARPESLQGSRAVGALLGSYLVQELADHLFGSESTEAKEGFVSRFEVETGTEISANGTESIVVNFRVIDHVYLQGERDIYEDVNVGLVYRIRFK